ncbi:MAG: M23 family peptidase, partial [Saccharothrix sp.]|nr:M23 family peptidase [Saccharothrix sp.]
MAAAVVAAGALATGVGAASGVDAGDTEFLPLAAGTDLAAALVHSSAPKPIAVETVHAVEPAFEAAKLMRSEGLFVRQHVDQAIRHASEGYAARQAELKRQQEAAAAEQARIDAENARVAEEAAR